MADWFVHWTRILSHAEKEVAALALCHEEPYGHGELTSQGARVVGPDNVVWGVGVEALQAPERGEGVGLERAFHGA